MKTLLAAVAALCLLAFVPMTAAVASDAPPECTVFSHPAGCVTVAHFVHGTTGFNCVEVYINQDGDKVCCIH